MREAASVRAASVRELERQARRARSGRTSCRPRPRRPVTRPRPGTSTATSRAWQKAGTFSIVTAPSASSSAPTVPTGVSMRSGPGAEAAQVLERPHHADQAVAAHPEGARVVEEDDAGRRPGLDRGRQQRAHDRVVPPRLADDGLAQPVLALAGGSARRSAMVRPSRLRPALDHDARRLALGVRVDDLDAVGPAADPEPVTGAKTAPARDSRGPTRLRAGQRRHAAYTFSGTTYGRAVLARQQLVGLGVAHERLGLPVELQLPPDPVGDVGQVRERRREVALLDAAGEHLRVVRADRVDEVPVVRALLAGEDVGIGAALRRRGLGARALLVPRGRSSSATCGRRRRSRASPSSRRRGCRSAACPRRSCTRRGSRTRRACRRRTRRAWCGCRASPARPAGRSSRRARRPSPGARSCSGPSGRCRTGAGPGCRCRRCRRPSASASCSGSGCG